MKCSCIVRALRANAGNAPQTLNQAPAAHDKGRPLVSGLSPLDPTLTGDLRDDLVREVVARFRRLAERIEKMFPHFFPEVAGLATHGGAGSGNFGHAGRPGEVGGSAPGGGEEGSSVAGGVKMHVTYDPRLGSEAQYFGEGRIVVGPKFFELPESSRSSTIAHEIGHELSDRMLRDGSAFDLQEQGAFGERDAEGLVWGINGKRTPGENVAEAYSVLVDEPEWLKAKFPVAYAAVRTRARKEGFPITAEQAKSLVPRRPHTNSLVTHGGAGSGNFDHAGRPGEVGGSAPRGSYVSVKHLPELVGKQVSELHTWGKKGLKQKSGAPLRGKRVLSPDDPAIPETLYHMTTALPAVLKSGYLRAGGKGGLGGDEQDRIVSLTISREIAEQLATDTKLVVTAAKAVGDPPSYEWNDKEEKWEGDRSEWGRRLNAFYAEDAVKYGCQWREGEEYLLHQLQGHNFGDWTRAYFTARELRTQRLAEQGIGKMMQDPMFWGKREDYAKLDPAKIGVVAIPKASLAKTGSLVVDFDLDNPYGLKEVRVYGDVPLHTNSLATNAPGDFNRNPSKTQMFLDWLKEVEEEEGGVAEKGWLDDALAGAMARGSRQAIGRLRGSKFGKRLPADDAQASAMLGATGGMRDRAEMLFTRAYGDLKGVTAKMDAQIGRIMAEGVMAGKNPKAIARELANEVEGMTLPRARTLARTEIVRAHHVATIQSYRELGVVGVEVVAEWLTSGLDNVCGECEELEGKQFTLDAIENMIPLHPNCRCTCVPVVEEPSEDLRDEAPARTEWDEEQEEPAEPLSEANPEIRDMSAEELADYAPAEEFDLGNTPLLLQREVVEGLDAALPAGADVQLDAVRLEGGELMRGSYAGYAESQGKREILLTPDLPWLAGEIATKHEQWQERKGFTSKAASRKEGRSWRWSTAMDSPAPVRDLTLHEASHALFEQNGEVALAFLKKVRTEYDAYDDVVLKDKVLRRDARYVSEAAVEDEGELFAEVSTLMLGGREKQVPAKLRTAWEAAREVVKGESK